MAFNPNNLVNWQAPKKSQRQIVLEKHGVSEKVMVDPVKGNTIILCRDIMDTKREILDKGFSDAVATTGAVALGGYEMYRSEPGESFKNFMIRLGWIVKNKEGKYVIA